MNALKKWAVSFLLSRGVNAMTEVSNKMVRNTIAATGGFVAAHGHSFSLDDQNTLIGAGMIVVAAALDVARTYLAKYAMDLNRPPSPTLPQPPQA